MKPNSQLAPMASTSPFTAALLRNLPTPGLKLRTTLTRVRSDMLRATGASSGRRRRTASTERWYSSR